MVVSVRAGLAACVVLLSLTAAADPPGNSALAQPALAQIAASAPDITRAVSVETPGYFVLQDRAEPPVETADGSTAPVADMTDVSDDSIQSQAAVASSDDLSAEERCLAVAVYYEARGEPLSGQRAVAHVVLNRARSGRFASTLCGVVRQPGQFSFRGRSFAPPVNPDWKRAVSVAREAMDGTGSNPAKGALFFHASYVAPGWDRAAIAQIGHHVFYR